MPIEPIKPRGFTIPQRHVVEQELDRLGVQVTASAKQYPAALPWKSRPPKTGPRAGGRRTGALGKSMGYKVTSGNDVVLEVKSSGVGYAKWVKGKSQTRVMSSRHWKKIAEDFAKYVPEAEKRLKLWARLEVK